MVTLSIQPMPITRPQQEFRQLNVWLRGFVGGRGSGKTRIGAVGIVREAKNGDVWLAVSPDNNMIRETTLPTFIEVAEFTGQLTRFVTSPTPRAWFRTSDGRGKAQVVFKGAEVPDKLRGGNYSGAWYDEASITHELAFRYGIATCRRHGVMGPCFATFTPRGFKHWTFESFYQRIADHEIEKYADHVKFFQGRPHIAKPNTALVHSRTKDNPFLPQEFELTVGSNYSSILGLQELGGEFVEIEGLMFKREWFSLVDEVPTEAARVRIWDKAACLVNDTQVTTNRGRISIEAVRVGDLVLTRSGWKSVTKAWLSKYTSELVSVIFSNGSIITGTKDHKIWTKNRKWVELGSLECGDYVLGESESCQELMTACRTLSSMGTDIQRSSGENITQQEFGTEKPRRLPTTHCTEPSGVRTSAIFPMAIISTTRTGIRITTTSRILNVFHQKTISNTTQTLTSQALHSLIQSTEQKHMTLFASGLPRTNTRQSFKEWPESGRLNLGATCPTSRIRANSVAKCSNPGIAFRQSSAAQAVRTNTQGPTVASIQSGSQTECASNAARFSLVQGELRHVATHVGKFYDVPVYDLSVADQHEFFADGVLVHNSSDSGCYTVGLLMARDRRGTFYVEDVVRGQWAYHERNQIMLDTCRRDSLKYAGTVLTYIEQEGGGDGKSVMDQLLIMLAAYPVYKLDSKGGQQWKHKANLRLPGDAKTRRALPLSGSAQAGNVRVLNARWTSEFLEELCAFPEYAYADQVDAASYAHNKLATVVPDNLYASRDVVDVDVSSYGETTNLQGRSTDRWEDLPWNKQNTERSGG